MLTMCSIGYPFCRAQLQNLLNKYRLSYEIEPGCYLFDYSPVALLTKIPKDSEAYLVIQNFIFDCIRVDMQRSSMKLTDELIFAGYDSNCSIFPFL